MSEIVGQLIRGDSAGFDTFQGKASKEAYKASARAEASGSSADHAKAAEAHRSAAKAERLGGMRASSPSGGSNWEVGASRLARASEHEKMAKEHDAKAGGSTGSGHHGEGPNGPY